MSEKAEKLVRDMGLKYRDAARVVYVLWRHGALELSELTPKPYGIRLKPSKPMALAITTLVVLTTFLMFYMVVSPTIHTLRFRLNLRPIPAGLIN